MKCGSDLHEHVVLKLDRGLHGTCGCGVGCRCSTACMRCRSTYDSKPPFRVYIDMEDDPSSAQKVLFQADTLDCVASAGCLGPLALHNPSSKHICPLRRQSC